MRVQTEEWRQFIPGVRMYKGRKTLFYNEETLWEGGLDGRPLIYDDEERKSWEVIIILPGVEVIPLNTFLCCVRVKIVIISDTMQRIEGGAFAYCYDLDFIRLSRNLEYIGDNAFDSCESLTSIFIPPSCREIGDAAFYLCSKLIIFNVPQQTRLGENAISNTALIMASPFETNYWREYENTEQVNQWIKNLIQGEEYELHRACSSFNPSKEIIYGIVKRKGTSPFQKKNEIGMTPFDYLEANPFVDIEIDQRALMKRYILEMMGETV